MNPILVPVSPNHEPLVNTQMSSSISISDQQSRHNRVIDLESHAYVQPINSFLLDLYPIINHIH